MYIRPRNETVMVLASHTKSGCGRPSYSRFPYLNIHKFLTGILNNIMVKFVVK